MPRIKQNQNRVSYTSFIDKDLLRLARIKAAEEGLEGANRVFEKALNMYLSEKGSLWIKNVNELVELQIISNGKEIHIVGEMQKEKNLSKNSSINLSESGYKKVGDIVS